MGYARPRDWKQKWKKSRGYCTHAPTKVQKEHLEILPRKMISDDADKVKESVRDYYGKRLKTSDDLQTNACKLGDNSMTPAVKNALKLIHHEVSSK